MGKVSAMHGQHEVAGRRVMLRTAHRWPWRRRRSAALRNGRRAGRHARNRDASTAGVHTAAEDGPRCGTRRNALAVMGALVAVVCTRRLHRADFLFLPAALLCRTASSGIATHVARFLCGWCVLVSVSATSLCSCCLLFPPPSLLPTAGRSVSARLLLPACRLCRLK